MSRKYDSTEIWSALEHLRYRPLLTKEYFGFAGAQGEAVAIKGERGIILDSQEGVICTNTADAAKYMAGEITWADVRLQKRFQVEIEGDQVITAWVESDRFVEPCSCRAIPVGGSIRVSGEDDCPVHGFVDKMATTPPSRRQGR